MFQRFPIVGSTLTAAVLVFARTAAADPPAPQPATLPGTPPAAKADDRARDAANATADQKETVENRAAADKSGNGANVNGESLTDTTNRNSPAQRFGRQRQFAFSSDEALTISSTTIDNVSGSVTNIQLEPAIDYFLFDNFSLGGFLLFDYTSAGAGHASTFGLGPRVGYNFSFSDLLSLWPKIGVSYDNVNTTTSTSANGVTTSSTSTASSVALNLFVPLMIHPAPHFFAGFGPFLDTDLSGDAKATTWGGKLTIGGWVGL